jgi:hypothetical protein
VRRTAALVIAGLALSAALVAPPCSADVPKAECIDANAKAQDLRRDHKLSQARELLALCADPSCPSLVRNDCEKRLVELESAQPSVVFDIVSGAGGIVSGAKVTVDGKAQAGTSGATLSLDPGSHSVTFEATGFAPLTRTVVMLEGDKGHHERVVLNLAAPDQPASTAKPEEGPWWWSGTRRQIGVVSAGVGVVGVVVGGVFGAMTLSEKSAQEGVCGSACSASAHAQATSDHSSGITDSTVSTVGFIAGGALLVAGAALFFTAGSSDAPSATALHVAPGVGPAGSGLLVSGRF